MPATLIEKTMPEGQWSEVGTDAIWTNLDNANGNYFPAHRDCFLMVKNTGASPETFTVTSEPYPGVGRTGDIAEIIEPGNYRLFRLASMGWADADGNTNLPAGQSADLVVLLFPVDPMTG